MARTITTFFNPAGVIITRKSHADLRKQVPDPYLIHEFENDRVFVQLRHTELIMNAANIPRNFWKMFDIRIYNIIRTNSEGAPCAPYRVNDPDSKGFVERDAAEAFYNSFLAKFTESHFDDDLNLIEVGNVRAPPDPDKPIFANDSPMAEEFGSW